MSFEGILSSLSSLKCLWISVEKSKETVGLENCFFDIETDKDVVEGFVEYFLGEPIKKFPMNIGFDIVMYDLTFATQTVIEIICDIILCAYLILGI